MEWDDESSPFTGLLGSKTVHHYLDTNDKLLHMKMQPAVQRAKDMFHDLMAAEDVEIPAPITQTRYDFGPHSALEKFAYEEGEEKISDFFPERHRQALPPMPFWHHGRREKWSARPFSCNHTRTLAQP